MMNVCGSREAQHDAVMPAAPALPQPEYSLLDRILVVLQVPRLRNFRRPGAPAGVRPALSRLSFFLAVHAAWLWTLLAELCLYASKPLLTLHRLARHFC